MERTSGMNLSDEEDYADIRAYFSKTEWIRLQRCEKVHYRNMKRNHQAMLDMGLNSITPLFMRRNQSRRVMAERLGDDKHSDSEELILHLLRRSPGNMVRQDETANWRTPAVMGDSFRHSITHSSVSLKHKALSH
ncbi:histone-lysine N-methyltransferase PRDM9-like [Brienomyrus brachyistius]|uniref:histone-lysine N-methyltransferase PRDM9-like n=1 Tax=Brienomyrus brachyistius TaxID=42636 RepID=UPI0020B325F5|nr:histone-lysine N-methyltransferase PRDM9-like [Brienomyrus brachyistius]